MVKEINSSSQFHTEISGPQLTVVDFFAHWCGPCKQIAPFIEQLSVKYPEVKFLKVDVDRNQDISAQYRIKAMPTFLFFKNGQQVDILQGANPGGIESKVIAHKVEVNPFANSKGHSLSSGTPNYSATNPRDARLAAFSRLETTKPASSNPQPDHVTSVSTTDVTENTINEEEEALARAIALSIESASSEPTVDTSTVAATSSQQDEEDDGFVPVPVNTEYLAELLSMGFSDIRSRKAIIHGNNVEGALEWLEQHQEDPDIDQPYLVKREDAERRDANGSLKPMSEEEKAQKIKEMQEKIKRMRQEKEKKAKEDEIIREKERRERGKKIDTISEEREKLLKKHEMDRAKREKEEQKKEKERLLAEIARDKEIRKKNAGVIPSVLGVEGYNPSALQYDRESSSTSSEPATKKQAFPSIPVEKQIETSITLISKYRHGNDGGNAFKLLITFLKNLVEHPDDPKYRSINMESNAFKTKLSNLLGPLNLLQAVGFEKVTEDGGDKLKYNHPTVEPIVSSTLAKLIEAANSFQAAS